MSTQDIIKTGAFIFLYLLLQILLVRNLILWDVALCFVYFAAILLLPGEMPTTSVLLVSFFIGLTVDIFYNTAGVHAAACTFIGLIRRNYLKYIFPTKNLENELNVSFREMGGLKFFQYVLGLTFIHCLLVFFLEAGGFGYFLITIVKVVASFIFTSLTIFLLSVFTNNLQKS
ncbi:hypothetical protein SAMN06298216_2244 [Spirosomataceae bacterium TFI 002]|nr:hypothetical protein SAMN06298216_2244 [Spirosomataceae bacterium TFI 002]